MAAQSPRAIAPPPSATDEEAAAIAAAIERFTHDTTPTAAGSGEALDPWTRAAMLEGVSRNRSVIGQHGDVPHPWINT